jgi:cell filamentation protein
VTDPYTDPATGILRNRLAVTDAAELHWLEARIVLRRDVELVLSPEPGSFDLAHLCRIHARLFGDIYQWAGQVRTVGIDKGVPFASPEHIVPYSTELFGQLRAEGHLRELGRGPFVDRLAHYVAEINAVHPFREGNGRAQRAFCRQLAAEAGWAMDWNCVSTEENVHASVRAMVGDLGPLRALLDRIVVPLVR